MRWLKRSWCRLFGHDMVVHYVTPTGCTEYARCDRCDALRWVCIVDGFKLEKWLIRGQWRREWFGWVGP